MNLIQSLFHDVTSDASPSDDNRHARDIGIQMAVLKQQHTNMDGKVRGR